MKETVSPPTVPLYWANHALEMERKLRSFQKWQSANVRQRIQLAKLETYFASNPPWEVIVEIVIDGRSVWSGVMGFPHEEGQVGYDNVLKTLWQKFNDNVLAMGVEAWNKMKK